MESKSQLFLIILLCLLAFFLSGCVEQIDGIPYTTGQFINRTTDLNISQFFSGEYNNQFLYVDGNKINARYIFSQRYYLHQEPANVSGYESLFTYPAQDTTHQDCVRVKDTNTHQLIDSYITDTNIPFSLVIPSGTWDFKTWASVDADLGDTFMSVSVYKRDSLGNEVFLFDTNSVAFDNGAVKQPDMFYTQANNIDLNLTDRIVVKYYANTTSPVDRNVCLYYEGADYYSYIDTPILGGTGQATGGSLAVWGSITGTLSNQTDLQDALDLKCNADGTNCTSLYTDSNVANYISSTYGDLNNDLNYLQSGDNISELINDAGYITSYTDTNLETAGHFNPDTNTINITKIVYDLNHSWGTIYCADGNIVVGYIEGYTC